MKTGHAVMVSLIKRMNNVRTQEYTPKMSRYGFEGFKP